MKPELDEQSQEHTTSHEWNGIKELNTPMPRVFPISLWASIGLATVLSVLYPGWPYVKGIGDYTKGVPGYSSRLAVDAAVAEGRALREDAFAPFFEQDIPALAANTGLREQFEPVISVLYQDNCGACHADNGLGGYENGAPNLTDDAWIYGGDRDTILETLQKGRAGHMPHWTGRITDEEIKNLALCVYWNSQDNGPN